jgi:hypothetical protein
MQLAFKAPGVPASSIPSPFERYEKVPESQHAKTCLPPSLDDSLPQDLLPSLKEAGSLEGGSGIRHSAGQAHVVAVPLTSTEGGRGAVGRTALCLCRAQPKSCFCAALIRLDSVTAAMAPPRDSTPPARVTINL